MSIRFDIARHAVKTVIVVMTGFRGADVQAAEAINGSLGPCLAALHAPGNLEISCEYMALIIERSDMVRLTREPVAGRAIPGACQDCPKSRQPGFDCR